MAWQALQPRQNFDPKGMAMSTITAHEKRVRHAAGRHGVRLHKLRGQNDSYWVIDNHTNILMLGQSVTRGVNIGYTLDAVESWLTGGDEHAMNAS
jgi:hypothetical protein